MAAPGRPAVPNNAANTKSTMSAKNSEDKSAEGGHLTSHFRSLRHLRELNLYHCRRLTDAGLESLADLPALETLHLNATPITDAGLKHLAQIKTLKSLNITDCQLSEDTLPWCRISK